MSRIKILFLVSAIVAGHMAWAPSADAGPLMDWFRNRCGRRSCPPPTAPCGTCTTTCQQTCTRTVVNYVPQTAYRCSWERVPVTTFRQTTSTDPCTGCTTTCNRPCTTYTWRMKQTPYTTFRPVYRQETFQVPVTYTTQVPVAQAAPAAVPMAVQSPGCSSCTSQTPVYTAPAGTIQQPVGTVVQNQTPQYYQQTPATGGTIYQQPTPATATGTTEADLRPSLNTNPQNMNRPVLIDDASGSSSTSWPTQIQTQPAGTAIQPMQDPNPAARWNNNPAPQLLNPFNQTTRVPSVQKWDYSPVQLASYQTTDSDVPAALAQPRREREYVGTVSADIAANPRTRVNEGWRTD